MISFQAIVNWGIINIEPTAIDFITSYSKGGTIISYNKTQGLQLRTVSDSKIHPLITLLTPEGHFQMKPIITISEIVVREATYQISYS